MYIGLHLNVWGRQIGWGYLKSLSIEHFNFDDSTADEKEAFGLIFNAWKANLDKIQLDTKQYVSHLIVYVHFFF